MFRKFVKICKDNGYGQNNDYGAEIEKYVQRDTKWDRKWFVTTFDKLWSHDARMILNDYSIFTNEAEKAYPAKDLQEGTGQILPLAQCPSEINDDMKW